MKTQPGIIFSYNYFVHDKRKCENNHKNQQVSLLFLRN